jgi:hypothetical protein
MLMLLGQDLFTGECSIHNGTKDCFVQEISVVLTLSLCLMLVLCLSFAKVIGENTSNQPYLKFIRWFIPIVIVFTLGCHLIGFFINIIFFHNYKFFTLDTIFTGILALAIISLIIILGYGVYKLYFWVRQKYFKYDTSVI